MTCTEQHISYAVLGFRPSSVHQLLAKKQSWSCHAANKILSGSCHAIVSQWFLRQLSRSGQAVVRHLLGSGQAVVRQWSDSRQAVVRQWSGSSQAVVRQSSGSGQAVVRQLSGSAHWPKNVREQYWRQCDSNSQKFRETEAGERRQ